MKYRDVVRMLEDDGWVLERTKGSHLQWRHPHKPGTVTIACGGKLGRDVPPGTLASIRKQAGIKGE
jgi:predicted RNA binding protein YcfA (HicA-like mRNA interferase family)